MQVILRNLMEDIVLHHLDQVISSLGVCTCEQCKLDIASFTLNRLPSKYVATNQGELLSKLDTTEFQFEASVIATIVSATEIVKKHPRHPAPAARL